MTLPVRRIFNWRFVAEAFQGDNHPWTRFVVDDAGGEDVLQVPAQPNGQWPASLAGPTVKVSRAWYNEFRYLLEHSVASIGQRIADACMAGDLDQIGRLLLLLQAERWMVWAPDRPMLIREVLTDYGS